MIAACFCPVCGAANEPARTHCFACGQLLMDTEDEALSRNETLLHDRYQLGTLLGSGGFSAVYRARDTRESGRVVAIKQINLQGMSAEEVIEATDTFNREGRVLSTLAHPQVPRIYDSFSDQNHWYLVLEYIEGQTLETFLAERKAQGRPLQLDEILAMALQLCTVLTYLHNCQPPLIYRDLKPGNIMRTPAGELCLIDFGIARSFRPGQNRDTQPLGSPGYAAPEQYGRAQTTPQADIYSLGALLHYLLSGQDPADHPSGLSPLRLNGQPGSAELEELVSRMLLPNPLERPASAHAVAWKLSRIRQQAGAWEPERIWRSPVPQAYPLSGGPQVHLPRVQTTISGGPQLQPSPVQTTVQAPPVLQEEGAVPALVGLILGFINLTIAFIPFWGIVTALIGIVVSSYGLSSISRKGMAIAGLVMSCVAAVITLASCAGGWFI